MPAGDHPHVLDARAGQQRHGALAELALAALPHHRLAVADRHADRLEAAAVRGDARLGAAEQPLAPLERGAVDGGRGRVVHRAGAAREHAAVERAACWRRCARRRSPSPVLIPGGRRFEQLPLGREGGEAVGERRRGGTDRRGGRAPVSDARPAVRPVGERRGQHLAARDAARSGAIGVEEGRGRPPRWRDRDSASRCRRAGSGCPSTCASGPSSRLRPGDPDRVGALLGAAQPARVEEVEVAAAALDVRRLHHLALPAPRVCCGSARAGGRAAACRPRSAAGRRSAWAGRRRCRPPSTAGAAGRARRASGRGRSSRTCCSAAAGRGRATAPRAPARWPPRGSARSSGCAAARCRRPRSRPSCSRVISGAQKSVSAQRGRLANTEPAIRQVRMSGDRRTRKIGAEPPLVATATVSSPTRMADGSGQSPARTGAGRARANPTAGRESQARSTRPHCTRAIPLMGEGARFRRGRHARPGFPAGCPARQPRGRGARPDRGGHHRRAAVARAVESHAPGGGGELRGVHRTSTAPSTSPARPCA